MMKESKGVVLKAPALFGRPRWTLSWSEGASLPWQSLLWSAEIKKKKECVWCLDLNKYADVNRFTVLITFGDNMAPHVCLHVCQHEHINSLCVCKYQSEFIVIPCGPLPPQSTSVLLHFHMKTHLICYGYAWRPHDTRSLETPKRRSFEMLLAPF